MFVLRLVYPVAQPWAFGLFPPLAIVNNAVVNTDVQIAARVHAFDSFGVYPGRIVRSYVNSVFDILRNHHSIFHSGCTILQYFSTFLPVLFILFFMIFALMGMKWYLIMILTYISLMIRMLSILSCAYWPFCISSLEKYLMKSFAHFSVWSFCCCCIIVLYIFWVPVPYQMHDLQMDLRFHSLPFTLL